MSPFTFETDKKSDAFCRAIMRVMVTEFGITEQEAAGRINRQWNGMQLVGRDHVIYHEDEEYWAHAIYYGKNSRWWTNPPGLKPQPFP